MNKSFIYLLILFNGKYIKKYFIFFLYSFSEFLLEWKLPKTKIFLIKCRKHLRFYKINFFLSLQKTKNNTLLKYFLYFFLFPSSVFFFRCFPFLFCTLLFSIFCIILNNFPFLYKFFIIDERIFFQYFMF